MKRSLIILISIFFLTFLFLGCEGMKGGDDNGDYNDGGQGSWGDGDWTENPAVMGVMLKTDGVTAFLASENTESEADWQSDIDSIEGDTTETSTDEEGLPGFFKFADDAEEDEPEGEVSNLRAFFEDKSINTALSYGESGYFGPPIPIDAVFFHEIEDLNLNALFMITTWPIVFSHEADCIAATYADNSCTCGLLGAVWEDDDEEIEVFCAAPGYEIERWGVDILEIFAIEDDIENEQLLVNFPARPRNMGGDNNRMYVQAVIDLADGTSAADRLDSLERIISEQIEFREIFTMNSGALGYTFEVNHEWDSNGFRVLTDDYGVLQPYYGNHPNAIKVINNEPLLEELAGLLDDEAFVDGDFVLMHGQPVSENQKLLIAGASSAGESTVIDLNDYSNKWEFYNHLEGLSKFDYLTGCAEEKTFLNNARQIMILENGVVLIKGQMESKQAETPKYNFRIIPQEEGSQGCFTWNNGGDFTKAAAELEITLKQVLEASTEEACNALSESLSGSGVSAEWVNYDYSHGSWDNSDLELFEAIYSGDLAELYEIDEVWCNEGNTEQDTSAVVVALFDESDNENELQVSYAKVGDNYISDLFIIDIDAEEEIGVNQILLRSILDLEENIYKADFAADKELALGNYDTTEIAGLENYMIYYAWSQDGSLWLNVFNFTENKDQVVELPYTVDATGITPDEYLVFDEAFSGTPQEMTIEVGTVAVVK
ncbi:MAG: hypothetical protein ABIA04_04720 [Pseudomonadota bacterium]